MNSSRAPSGDHDSVWFRLFVPLMNVSVPPKRCLTTIEWVAGTPDCRRMNAIFVPSGDHRGENLRPLVLSSMVCCVVARLTVFTVPVVPPVSSTHTTWVLSGDQSGSAQFATIVC